LEEVLRATKDERFNGNGHGETPQPGAPAERSTNDLTSVDEAQN
jgi:hypothetical protein